MSGKGPIAELYLELPGRRAVVAVLHSTAPAEPDVGLMSEYPYDWEVRDAETEEDLTCRLSSAECDKVIRELHKWMRENLDPRGYQEPPDADYPEEDS